MHPLNERSLFMWNCLSLNKLFEYAILLGIVLFIYPDLIFKATSFI